MTTVKIKFRPSTIDGKQGKIVYQVIHNRLVREKRTNYHIYEYEWNKYLSEIVFTESDKERNEYLLKIKEQIHSDMRCLYKIIHDLNQNVYNYTSEDVFNRFITDKTEKYFFSFMGNVITNLKVLGKMRTSETYATTLNSFKRFRNNRDLALDDIDSEIMTAYEAYLRNNGITHNSSSFYLRNLRAVYNRAVDKGLTIQRFPFKHVYTGVDKTVKRALPLKTIKQIKDMDLSMSECLDLARNMFLFSFYTRGMSFIDMAYLKKNDLKAGILSYRRRKTGQQLFIKWEDCMQEIVDKYDKKQSIYLLPIINEIGKVDERKQYIYKAHNINRALKIIGRKLNLSISLTMYVARHAWASIAKSKNIPLSIISEGMGHDSEATTRIYLASLDTLAIDKANSIILKSL